MEGQGEQPAEPKLPDTQNGIRLFQPDGGSSIVAIFAHGVVQDAELDPISGVDLGYYSPHGDTVDANITWAAGDPTHPPQASANAPNGKWASYVLSSIGLGDGAQAELASSANEYGMAIAYVVDATSTATLVPVLAGMGYTDIRGVHCRESLDKEQEVVFGEASVVTHQTLVDDGWIDMMGDSVTADSQIGEGELLTDSNRKSFKVESVDGANNSYTIVEYKGAG